MLLVVVAAGLSPNTGTVSAQSSSCPYGGCPVSSSVPVWEYASILAVIAVAVIVAVLVLLRRRRPPRAAAVAPVPSGPAGEAGAPPPAGPPPPYLETPEDIGTAPPSIGPRMPEGAAGAAGAAAGAESGSDIDSLMAELDKISSDILKRSPKKGANGKELEESEGESTSR